MASLADGGNIFRLSKNRLVTACHGRMDLLTLYADFRSSLEELAGTAHKPGGVASRPKRLAVPPLSMLGLDQYFKAKIFAARKPGPRLTS